MAKSPQKNAESPVSLHRLGFVDWQPSGIMAMAKSEKWLAVLRSDGSLGVHGISSGLPLLYAQPLPFAVECLCFVGADRLMLGGVDGRVREWSVPRGVQVGQLLVSHQPVWSLCRLPGGRLAVGCEDGAVRLLAKAPQGAAWEVAQVFPSPQSSRILSLALSRNAQWLAAGTASGCILLHNLKGQQGQKRLALSEDAALVWSLAWLKGSCGDGDECLAAGDSRGRVSWFDVASGTLIREAASHTADVLCLQSLRGRLYASGVDARLVEFDREGCIAGRQRLHSHDVRAMVALGAEGGVLVTGSLDTTLMVISLGSSSALSAGGRFQRVRAAVPPGHIKLVGQQLLAVQVRSDCLRLWSLAEPQRLLLELQLQQAKLLDWDVRVDAEGGCSLALLDARGHLRLYAGAAGEGLRKLKLAQTWRGRLLRWLPDGRLVLVGKGGVYLLDQQGGMQESEIALAAKGARLLAVGEDRLAVAIGVDTVAEIDLDAKQVTLHQAQAMVTALEYCHGSLVWTDALLNLRQSATKQVRLSGIDRPVQQIIPREPAGGLTLFAGAGQVLTLPANLRSDYRQAIYLGATVEGHLVMVEQRKEQVEASLPPVLKRSRYGRK